MMKKVYSQFIKYFFYYYLSKLTTQFILPLSEVNDKVDLTLNQKNIYKK